MSDNGQNLDVSAADQAGLTMLADGGDLFDLSHVTPASEAAPVSQMALSSDLLHLHDPEAQPPEIRQLAAASEPVAPSAPDTISHSAEAETTAAPAKTSDGHAPALSMADVMADAAQDLASFHTASGPAAHAVTLGSTFFTPFTPAPQLGGFTELHVIHPG